MTLEAPKAAPDDANSHAIHKGFRERYKNEIRRELLRALEERTPPSLTALLEGIERQLGAAIH